MLSHTARTLQNWSRPALLLALAGCSNSLGTDGPARDGALMPGETAPDAMGPDGPGNSDGAGDSDDPGSLAGQTSSTSALTPSGGSPTAAGSDGPAPVNQEPTPSASAPAAPSSSGFGAPTATAGAEPAAPVCDPASLDPGPSPLRLLSRAQYRNTLTALLGEIGELNSVFTTRTASAEIGAGQGDVSQVELENFQHAAEIAAAKAVERSRLDSFAPCTSEREGRDCARDFLANYGALIYRAPLTDADDIERHLALFDVGAAMDYRNGIELLLRGMLQSSRFLYQVELGTDELVSDSAVPLSGYELAARLSYAFWNSAPDEALLEAAAKGELSSQAGLQAVAQQVLADPRAAATVRGFLEALTHVESVRSRSKDPDAFPEWQSSLPSSLAAQAQRYFDYVLQDESGRLSTLLSSSQVFVNADLAAYYPGPELEALGALSSDEFIPLEVNNGTVAGLLTLPAFLAWAAKPDESSPIYRGKFVREMLLCQNPPAPPAKIPKPPVVEPDVSTRERLRQHEVDPACSGCHALLDPIGFGFEHYDAIGRYRDNDGGEPVDARGEIIGTRELDGEFDGVQELALRLAASSEVQDCIARQYFRYVMSRFEVKGDACSLQQLTNGFRTTEANLNTLPAAMVATDSFAYRRPIAPSASTPQPSQQPAETGAEQ